MAFFLVNGLIAGIILAAFLALCDGLFQTDTFTVLIDVNYVPGLAGLPSVVELLIHLLISVLVTAGVFLFYPRNRGRSVARYLLFWLLALTLVYFPLSLFSGVPVSLAAFFVWLLGHVIYLLFLAFQVERFR